MACYSEYVHTANDLVNVPNVLTAVLVDHTIARLQFWRDKRILFIRENGKRLPLTSTDEADMLKTRAMRFFLPRRLWKVAVVIVMLALAIYLFSGEAETRGDGTTFPARRGPLKITVLEGGTLEAIESQEIKSEVPGQTKIISIVEEGYRVTREDVDTGKVLVELDSSELVEKLTRGEIEYQSTMAAYAEAREQYQIQISENESSTTAAELEAKFSWMDFEKYVGSSIADELQQRIRQEEDKKEVSPIDFPGLAKDPRLAGEAQQKREKLESDFLLAREELTKAETFYRGTKRLMEQGYETSSKEEEDRLKVMRSKTQLNAAQRAVELFLIYEFAKEAEKKLSDYVEFLRKLDRSQREAVSKLAKAEARLRSTEAQYKEREMHRDKLKEQIEHCTIKAEREGLVVYGNPEEWYRQEQITEGATVRERQKIITIPDMTEMAVKAKIHESDIKKIEKAQKASITVDAYPDEELTGEVIKVAVLPDSSQRWINPDLKIFPVTIRIDGVHDWLKPGMSAEVEILIDELEDVLFVPIQAVSHQGPDQICYIAQAASPKRCVVETGSYNTEFIEIKSGLEEGEPVLLRLPEGVIEPEADDFEDNQESEPGPTIAAPAPAKAESAS